MDTWLSLHGWPDEVGVQHIRLLCVPSLQTALDARYSIHQWEALSVSDALDAVGSVALRAVNQAVLWSDFFGSRQGRSEPMAEYFQKCTQQALDCDFRCPHCDGDLSDYMVLRKAIVGLSNPALKKELFQQCDVYSDVDKLRAKCMSYEAAERDSCVGGASAGFDEWREGDVSLAAYVSDVGAHGTVAAASRPLCSNCGGHHAMGKASCPARDVTCHHCQRRGHYKRMCRSRRRPDKGQETLPSSGAVSYVGEVRRGPQPLVAVLASLPGRKEGHPVMAVADTGAQVCVAGPSLLAKLGIKEAGLIRKGGLRDVADLPLTCLGTVECCFALDGRSTRQDVFVVKTARNVFLSLAACKDLGLVPDAFPFHIPAAAGTGVDSVSDPSLPPPPQDIPFPPLEENVGRLQEWLKQHFSASTFNTEKSPLPVMAGAPHHIHLHADARPYACHTPAQVPRHWEREVKKQLDDDVRMGVLLPVPAGESTEWCARMVVVAKKSGRPRRTVDYQRLNACCSRETHHTRAPFDIVSSVPTRTYKTVADAFSGFHQVELDEASSRLTTFITPWGRYRYLRTPMGHCAASDAYTKRFDDAIADIPRKFKCVDDTLLFDSSVEQAFWHVYSFLEKCARRGITLQPEKFQFAKREVDFVGFSLGWEQYKPSGDKLAAIKNFPMPSQPTITDIRSWHGLVNQLAPFMATAPAMEPFRELLKKPVSKKIYWDLQLQRCFELAKDTICRLVGDGLVYYDQTRPTAIVTDWSKEGLGFVILQQYCSCVSADTPFCCRGGWRLALCGSRHLSPAEVHYAAVEGETLAVVWCLHKARLFLLGCPNLLLVTDHRPLVGLLGDRALKDISNPRLFRLKEKTLQFHFQVKYLPGKKNCAADALSRYPALAASPDAEDLDMEEDLTAAVVSAVAAALGQEGITMDQETVQRAAVSDPSYQLLLTRVLANDWAAHRGQEIACLRPYYTVRDRLATAQGLVTYTFGQGSVRLVIPESLREQVTANLHAGHQGLDSMLRRARQSVYWPGMEGDLQQHRSNCLACETHAPSQSSEPITLTPPPEYPFQKTVVDLFQLDGRQYLAYADRLTGWLEVAHFPRGTTSGHIIPKLRSYFTRWGAPEEVSMDGGTNLASEEMSAFFRKWAVTVRLSSAHYPQSNGRAEVAVKVAKRILRGNTGAGGSLKTDRVSQALLQYLNTPLHGGDKSPAQLATGRQLRDGVPTLRQHYLVDRHWKASLRERELRWASRREEVQLGVASKRTLPPLDAGQAVRIQDQATLQWDRTGVVVGALPHRQYLVRLDGSGRTSHRNRRHLRAVGEATSIPPSSDVHPPAEEAPRQRPKRIQRRPGWLDDFI